MQARARFLLGLGLFALSILSLLGVNAPQLWFDRHAIIDPQILSTTNEANGKECRLILDQVNFGPRHFRPTRHADLSFKRDPNLKNCDFAHIVLPKKFSDAYDHDSAMKWHWRTPHERSSYSKQRCPLAIKHSSAGQRIRLRFDLTASYRYRGLVMVPCTPVVSLETKIAFFGWNKQRVLIIAPLRTKSYDIQSRDRDEVLTIRTVRAGAWSYVTLDNSLWATIVLVLNIVFSSIMGVAAAACFDAIRDVPRSQIDGGK